MRILFLSTWFPYPPNNGSKLRVFNLLRALAHCHETTLLTFADEPGANPEWPDLRSLCRKVLVVPGKNFHPSSYKAALGLLSLTPRWLVDTYSPEMARNLLGTLIETDFDLAIASEIGTAIYGRYLSRIPALFEEVELGVLYGQFARATSPWRRFRYGLTWAKHRRYLSQLLREYRGCTVVSQQEKALLSETVPGYGPIEVVPNSLDLANYKLVKETPQPNSLIFTGSFRYFANYEAMVWFLRNVYPLIRAACPDTRLAITGDHADRPIPAMDNVVVTGAVDDVRPFIARAWVSLAPILSGGGSRLKILEAMALHTPVVATSKGAEGLDLEHGKHLLIGDTPESFANAVISVLKDQALRHTLVDNAYQLVSSKYDYAVVMPRFLDVVERMARLPG